ncbi:hypothetical protein [Tateyamaria sp.]|uniref:hypothetical protein n=1 Tax=Tateyamaria sp. TaxID=1929288 RepID=UPI00329CA317
MKNVVILSLSLVALSGGAGLGLSALHEFNMNVQTSALATPDNIPTDSGFVIPDHVPDAAQFATLAPTLPTPQVIEAPALAPVETAALGDFDLNQIEVTPEATKVAPIAPAVRKAIAAPAKVIKRRAAAKRPAAKRPAVEAPVFVAQAPALLGKQGSAARIDYVIGVYR